MDGSVLGEPTLRRSSDVDSIVVLLSRRMAYLDDDVESGQAVAAMLINSEVTRGIFWMVPQTGELLRVIVTRVPRGKGSGT